MKALIGHKIGGTVVTSVDSIIISTFLGLKIVAYYSNYYYIVAALVSMISVLSNSILGSLGNRLVCCSKRDNIKLFYDLSFGVCWIVGWCSICLLCLYQPFMTLWMGSERLLNNSTVICLVIYFYSWQFRIVGLNFKDAAGMWKEDFWKPYIGSLVNIILNVILVQYIGLNGVIIATIIDFIIVYFPWETKVIFEKLFQESSKQYYFKQIRYFVTTIIIAIITYICCMIFDWGNLIVNSIVCIVVPNLLYIFSYRRCEEFIFLKKQAVNILKKLIKGKR